MNSLNRRSAPAGGRPWRRVAMRRVRIVLAGVISAPLVVFGMAAPASALSATLRSWPTASNLNFAEGQVVANQVTYNGWAAADLIVDVAGYYPTGTAYNPFALPGACRPRRRPGHRGGRGRVERDRGGPGQSRVHVRLPGQRDQLGTLICGASPSCGRTGAWSGNWVSRSSQVTHSAVARVSRRRPRRASRFGIGLKQRRLWTPSPSPSNHSRHTGNTPRNHSSRQRAIRQPRLRRDLKHPGPVAGLSFVITQITAGGQATCALLSSGGVNCWGYSDDGELGNGTTTDSSAPVEVTGLG